MMITMFTMIAMVMTIMITLIVMMIMWSRSETDKPSSRTNRRASTDPGFEDCVRLELQEASDGHKVLATAMRALPPKHAKKKVACNVTAAGCVHFGSRAAAGSSFKQRR